MNAPLRQATFHEGEVALQASAGTAERLAEIGSRVIRSYMPDQHREFFEQLPFLVAGTVDAQGQPWASVLAGPAGFVESPDAQHLVVNARPLPQDPMRETLSAGAPIGLLGIEPHTRRRNRANGRVLHTTDHGFTVEVTQSFGNCPKYIQARRPEYVERPYQQVAAERAPSIDAHARQMIAAADTFFIATAHPQARTSGAPASGVDVSHRGGLPGFARMDDDGSALTVPDYLGNFFFNTLGNLAVEPRCGLLFIDFENGDLLYVAAHATIVTESAELESFPGAERLLRLAVTSVIRVAGVLPLAWGSVEYSPYLNPAGPAAAH